MTSQHEALVEKVMSTRPYETGSIHKAGQKSEYTVCDASGHIMFFDTREAAETECERMNARAIIALIAEETKEATERMVSRWALVTPVQLSKLRLGENPDERSNWLANNVWRIMHGVSALWPQEPSP